MWCEHLNKSLGSVICPPHPETWQYTQVGESQSDNLAVESLLFTADEVEGKIK